jgi:hypothetical protein
LYFQETTVATPTYYLAHIEGDVDPILHGPFETEDARNEKAVEIRLSGGDLLDGLFKLDIKAGKPELNAYTGGEIDKLVEGAVLSRGYF